MMLRVFRGLVVESLLGFGVRWGFVVISMGAS